MNTSLNMYKQVYVFTACALMYMMASNYSKHDWQHHNENTACAKTFMHNVSWSKKSAVLAFDRQCTLNIYRINACYILQIKFHMHSVKITTWKYGSICTLRGCMLPECRTMLLNVIKWPTNGPKVRLWINKCMKNPAAYSTIPYKNIFAWINYKTLPRNAQ